jgi:hypothetical protein
VKQDGAQPHSFGHADRRACLQPRPCSVLGTTSAENSRLKHCTMQPMITSSVLDYSQHVPRGPAIGSTLPSVGLKMDNTTVRIAAGLRLGVPVVQPHVCVCGSMVTVDGHHSSFCRHGSGRFSRNSQINKLLCRAFVSAGTLATREPHSLCTNNGKRPDGVRQVPWKRSQCLARDATCPDIVCPVTCTIHQQLN